MKRVHHREDQIRRKLRLAEAAIAHGASVLDVCHELSISEATYHRWRKKYAARDASDGQSNPPRVELAGRLKEIEKENKRLKQLVGQLMLDNALLKDALDIKHAHRGL